LTTFSFKLETSKLRFKPGQKILVDMEDFAGSADNFEYEGTPTC